MAHFSQTRNRELATSHTHTHTQIQDKKKILPAKKYERITQKATVYGALQAQPCHSSFYIKSTKTLNKKKHKNKNESIILFLTPLQTTNFFFILFST